MSGGAPRFPGLATFVQTFPKTCPPPMATQGVSRVRGRSRGVPRWRKEGGKTKKRMKFRGEFRRLQTPERREGDGVVVEL